MDSLKTSTMIIYKITNLKNGKCYIGQTQRTFYKRYEADGEGVVRVFNSYEKAKKMKRSYNKHLYNAMLKDGIENFTIEILKQCKDYEELNEEEKYYIRLYNSSNPDYGYNIQAGGHDRNYNKKAKKERAIHRKKEKRNKKSLFYELTKNCTAKLMINHSQCTKLLTINERRLFFTLLLFNNYGINNVDYEVLRREIRRDTIPRSEIEKILDDLARKNILEYNIINNILKFNMKKIDILLGNYELIFYVEYKIDFVTSMECYGKFFNQDVVLLQCKKCGKYTCVKRKAYNTKYCEECKKENARERNRERRKKVLDN